MGVFLFLIILLNISVFMSISIKKDISQTIFLSLIFLLLFLYIMGIFSLLKYSIFFIVTISFLFMIFNIFYLVKNPDFIKKYLWKPALLFIILAFVFAFIFFRNAYLRNWDEYTHWGLYPKNIYNFDSLSGSQLTSTNNGYPPITSLMQYLILNLDSVFKESNLYRSMFLFSTITLTPLLQFTSLKKPLRMLFTFFIIICFPLTIFIDYYSSIYVDALLALLFVSLMLKLYMNKVSLFNWVYMFLICSILMLVKEFGLILNGIFYFLLLLDILFIRRKEYYAYFNLNIKPHIYRCGLICIAFLFPLFTKYSWMFYLSQQIAESHSQLSAVSLSYPEYGNEIINSFMKMTFSIKSPFGQFMMIPAEFMIIPVVLLLICILFTKKKKDSKILGLLSISSIISFLLYNIALLISYLFLFGEIEAKAMASYSRYVSTILLALILISIFIILIYDYKNKFKNNIPYIFLIAIMIVLFPFRNMKWELDNIGSAGNEKKYLSELKHKTADTIVNDIPNAKIYYICQGSNGFEYWFNRYYLTPNHIQEVQWALSSLEEKDYSWVWKKSADEWSRELAEYDYLYLERIDEKFLESYSNLFENPDSIMDAGLYKVLKSNDNISLQFVKEYTKMDVQTYN